MAAERQLRGARAEQAAAALLVRAGLTQVAANARFRGGELDLVMLDGAPAAGTLVFVEVRSRSASGHGGAAATVGPAKQRSLILAARHFLLRWPEPPPCRFDVVAIDAGQLQWIRAAFDAPD